MNARLCAQYKELRKHDVRGEVDSSQAVHHSSWRTFSTAREAGCRLCSDIWRRFVKNCWEPCVTPGDERYSSGFQTYYRFDLTAASAASTNLPGSLVFGFPCFAAKHSARPPHSGWTYDILLDQTSAVDRGESVKSPESYLRQYVTSRPHFDSDAVYELVKSWESCCERLESDFTQSQRTFTPTRLLKVGNVDGPLVKLFDVAHSPDRKSYVALTYCWGPAQNHILTKNYLAEAEQGLETKWLSRTAQDAISFTRRLGCQYLWIDALRIVQDDPEDWGREAARMQDVYANAWLTVAASAATGSDQGFLHQGDVEQAQAIVLCHAGCRQGVNEAGLRLVDADIWRDEVEMSPLSTRAWCVQERLLSPRMVFFGKNQVFWECQHMHACEMVPEGFPKRELAGVGRSASFTRFASKYTIIPSHIHAMLSDGPSVRQAEGASLRRAWRNLVAQYTGCDLTFKDDRLIAISGAITVLQEALQSRNLAGLWADDLINELLWRRIGNLPEAGMPNLPIPFLPKPQHSRAPSWSWVAVDGPVQYVDYPVSDRNVSDRRDAVELAEVIEADITSPTTIGRAKQTTGYVRLQCSMHNATVQRAALQEPDTRISFKVGCDCGLITAAQVQADDALEEYCLAGKRLALVPLLSFSQSVNGEGFRLIIGGLVLTGTNVSMRYERFGRFECHDNASCNSVSTALLTEGRRLAVNKMQTIDLV